MSAPSKLRPGNSEITKLKLLWRDLADDARAFWQELFVSQTSQAEIRRQLLMKLKVNLRFDKQLNAFRDWELEQRAMDLEAERQAEDERRTLAENPTWTLDQAREVVFKKTYQRVTATGDFMLGLKTVAAEVKAKALDLDKEKFKEALQTKIQAGLQSILDEAKGNPVIAAAVKQIQEVTE